MKNSMKNLTVITMLLCGITFGQEAVASTEESSTTISGEFSTDITFGETTTFSVAFNASMSSRTIFITLTFNPY